MIANGSARARLLLIRFSSFGDIVQAVGVPTAFKAARPGAEVHWLVRADFEDLLAHQPNIDKVLPFARAAGLKGLLRLAWSLPRLNRYTHIYDAHNNLRSLLFSIVYFASAWLGGQNPAFARRPKERLRRWLFFRFRLPFIKMPFRGAESYHRPLVNWGLPATVPVGAQMRAARPAPTAVSEIEKLPHPRIALAPAAAWEMKRWPPEHWRSLMTQMQDASFVLLGGPEDAFIHELAKSARGPVLDLAGKLKLIENAAALERCDLVIANDTGLLHVADQLERPTIALIGPTAFGYPSHPLSRTLEIELACKPCSKDGRGKCVNSVYQRCLVEISPERVAQTARAMLEQRSV